MIAIRDAVHDDASAIAAIHFGTWETAYRGILADEVLAARPLEDFVTHWQQQLPLNPPTFCLVALDGNEPLGFIRAGAARDGDLYGDGEVYSFYVRKAYEGSGIGTQLLTTAVERLQGARLSDIYLWVLDGNEKAQRFYEKRGWLPAHTVKVDHSYGVPVTDLLYTLPTKG